MTMAGGQVVVATSVGKRGVPAVRNSAAILRLLRSDDGAPHTMTSIARGLGLNGSTCHNLLKTLEDEGFVAFDSTTRTYDLGLALVDLASGIDGHSKVIQAAEAPASAYNRSSRLACFLLCKSQDKFLVLHKVESLHPIKVTIDVGTYFAMTTPALLKTYLAWQDPGIVTAFLKEQRLPRFTPNSITEDDKFVSELAEVRTKGYALSLREYHPDHHAITVPIFDRTGKPAYYFLTVGFANDLPDPVLLEYAGYLNSAADEVTARIRGHHPVAA